MAGVSPWHINIPQPAKQAPVAGGNPWHIPGAGGSTIGTSAPPAMPAPYAPPPAAPPPPPPPPPDYWALSLVDPQYTAGKGLIERSNTMNLQSLSDAWKQQGQAYQDNANRHGALFSGASINAQRHNDQAHTDAVARQALTHDQNLNDLRWGVFNRLVAGVANPNGV